MMSSGKDMLLFGGDKSWNASDWTASDDRVRGGKSQSHLDVSNSSKARFHGNLDIKTLGGAGFASQRTTTQDSTWDLSEYEGILIHIGKSDGKRYTFIIKDKLLPSNPENGREQATTSWEYDFKAGGGDATLSESSFVYIPWANFKPTYRGKEKKDAGKLDRKNVKRFSIMMRSFFGDQEGNFSITIHSITAVSKHEDIEKGFVAAPTEKSEAQSDEEESKSSYSSTLFKFVVLGLIAYAWCTLICPYPQDMHIRRHWI